MSRRIHALAAVILGASPLAGCWSTPATVAPGAEGESTASVQIDSSPTSAWIYVDSKYVGTTPLEHYFAYSSTTENIEIVAEPIFPTQTRQRRRIQVRPLPHRLHFFMNNRTGDTSND
jgi:hypothetical protein